MKKFQSKFKQAKKQFDIAKQKYRIEFGLKLNVDNYYRQIFVVKNNVLCYRKSVPEYLQIADKRLNHLYELYKHKKMNRKKRKQCYIEKLKHYGNEISTKIKRQIWKQSIGRNIWNS